MTHRQIKAIITLYSQFLKEQNSQDHHYVLYLAQLNDLPKEAIDHFYHWAANLFPNSKTYKKLKPQYDNDYSCNFQLNAFTTFQEFIKTEFQKYPF